MKTLTFAYWWIFLSVFRTRTCNLELEENSEKIFRLNAFSDAIQQLYLEKFIDFDIIVYRNADKSTVDQIEVLKSGNYSYKLKLFGLLPGTGCFNIENSAIIFLEDMKALNEFNFYARLTNLYPKSLKFLIWLDDTSLIQVNAEHLYDDYGDITQYEYIIFYMEENLKIFSFEWFVKGYCGLPMLEAIDVFDVQTMHWGKNVTKYQKFKNFNECLLFSNLGEIFVVNAYIDITAKKMKGLLVDLFDAMGQKGNFVSDFLPIPAIHKQVAPHCMNQKFRTGMVRTFYHVFHKIKANGAGYHVTSTFHQTSFIFLITPSEPITITEKLFLPFDTQTWIMLIITFVTAFLVIFISHLMPEKIRNLIFGKGIKTPGLNIFFIFFGIGQMKIPDKSFPRFLLMVFILFCLIFRTCYQSKLFEFMTSDMRKASPMTIDDLYENNFTIYALNIPSMIDALISMINEKRRSVCQFKKGDHLGLR